MAWRCFHCGEVLRTEASAAEHFGRYEDALPICKVGAERYRDLEAQLARYRDESDELSKSFYAMGSKHAGELRTEGDRQYGKGLRDAAKQPWTTLAIALGLRRSY